VNIVAYTKDVLTHTRVPTVFLVTKVDASFQKLTHGEIGQCHTLNLLIFPV
jgi:hypothetical protein